MERVKTKKLKNYPVVAELSSFLPTSVEEQQRLNMLSLLTGLAPYFGQAMLNSTDMLRSFGHLAEHQATSSNNVEFNNVGWCSIRLAQPLFVSFLSSDGKCTTTQADLLRGSNIH